MQIERSKKQSVGKRLARATGYFAVASVFAVPAWRMRNGDTSCQYHKYYQLHCSGFESTPITTWINMISFGVVALVCALVALAEVAMLLEKMCGKLVNKSQDTQA